MKKLYLEGHLLRKKRRAWGNSGSFAFIFLKGLIFMEESLLGLLKQEDSLIKNVKETHDMSEFYSDRANEYGHAMNDCDSVIMHEVFADDMLRCETKAEVYREKEMKARKELKDVRNQIRDYILFIGSKANDEEEGGDIRGF